MGLRLRLARTLLAHPKVGLGLFALLTAFFALGLPHVQLKTIFADLLPQDDPFVQIYRDHPNFGNPLTMIVMVRNRDGDIYNPDTLKKVWDLTRDLDLAPGVDHDQILSIATEKARYSEATPTGVDMQPLMDGAPPQTHEELSTFRSRVDRSSNVRTFLISPDQHSTLLYATFIEQRVDWGTAFEYVQKLVEQARDSHHDVYLAGQPALIGWVYRHEWQMVGIFAVTIMVLIIALWLYMRSWLGLIAPLLTSAVAAIWAFGAMGWVGISIEPLLMVVPLLLTARSFSHGVQYTERYCEYLSQTNDRLQAAEQTLSVMMAPSLLGIITDILGIIVVVAAPIPAMVRHALFCGLWAVWLIPTGIILMALLLACLPAPALTKRPPRPRLTKALAGAAWLCTGTRRRWTLLATVLLSCGAIWTAHQIRYGNPTEGSNLLWPESEFNRSVRAINRNFPGVNTLEIILEAKNPNSPDWNAQRVDTIATMQNIQSLMEHGRAPPRATLSFADYLTEVNRLFNGGNPRWLSLDQRQRAVSAAAIGALMGTSSKNFSHVASADMQHATVSLWYADNRQETVDAALSAARRAIQAVGEDHPTFRIRLGSGVIALQEAVNRVIERYHSTVVGLLNLFIFVMCAVTYRSIVAGLLLLVPVNLANAFMIASMHLLGVGLDVNSMIVAAIGLGVGIDYGIYLLSRIREEYASSEGDWDAALYGSLTTTGRAIAFTAAIMALSILPWYALSGLKFVADMGLLLIAIMIINMLLSLLVLPLLVSWIRPGFIKRAHAQGAPPAPSH